jgi:cadmium resistance protein CadD (predicted permease)
VIEILSLIGLGIAVFVSTNIDDLLVLLALFSDRRIAARSVAIGQFAGIAALVGASALGSLVSLVLSRPLVGLLGLLPILIGARQLLDLRGDDGAEPARASRGDALRQIGAVAAVTIANGGDNVGVYLPWFATLPAGRIALIALLFALMTGLWLAIGHGLVRHPVAGALIRRHGRIALPLVLIALGISILYQAGSFGLFR